MRPIDAHSDPVSQQREEVEPTAQPSPALDEMLQVLGRLLGDIFLESENEKK